MAIVNSHVLDQVKSRIDTPLVLNLAAATLRRDWRTRLLRGARVPRALLMYVRALVNGHARSLYIGISGGSGQLYDCLFITAARLCKRRIFIHHHSFAYVDEWRFVTSFLVALAGRSATHIVLCESMRERFEATYRRTARVRVVSNATVQGDTNAQLPSRREVTRLGFLGNISREKGILEVLAVAGSLKHEDIEVLVAGPFEDRDVQEDVADGARSLPNVRLLGPKYGLQKEEFFSSIDVLLFPTKYKNEAAPLVVYEALRRGIPVIAWSRGCLGGMVPAGGGLAIAPDDDFVENAVRQILEWRDDAASFVAASERARSEFERELAAAHHAMTELIDELCF
jgi:glycosyltransferase involved in cell wall biosynthesis